MAPEFEAAAKELEGRVKFVKLDTDEEPEMAGRYELTNYFSESDLIYD